MHKTILISFSILWSSLSLGQSLVSGGMLQSLRLGTGLLAYNTFETSQDETGEAGTFGTNYALPLQLQIDTPFFWGLGMSPRLLYTPIGQEAPEGGSTSRILMLSLPATYTFSEALKGSFGLGYMIRTIKGSGGTIEVNNGLGTSTFLLPGQSRSSKNFLLEAGVSYDVGRFFVNLEGLLAGVLTERRSVSFLFSLNYKLFE